MKTFLISALAFGILTSTALAESVVLSDAQLDTVTAGQVTQTINQTATQTGAAIGGSVEQSVTQSATQEGSSISLGTPAE